MTMYEQQDYRGWIGRTLVGADGGKIGEITDLYTDDDTGQPEWVAVKTGWFGSNVSFVPIEGATTSGDGLQVRWDKERVKGAPTAVADGHLSQDEEQALYAHYGLSYTERRSDSGLPDGGAAYTGTDTTARSTDDAMTRSEEELRVGTTSREAGRVRLRKWVETEHVTKTVPVSHEEVVVEREPITDANRAQALQGVDITESVHEVVLHEERPVVDTEVVPKERVRLETETVVEEEQVGADLRKERIEVERDDSSLRGR